MTVYGCINNRTGEFLWMLHRGTNQTGWKMFLRDVKEHLDQQYETNATLVIDNHAVHRARGVVPFYDGFRVLFTPPYCSDLNSIETVWAILKARLSKRLNRITEELDQLDFEAEIDRECALMSVEVDFKKLMFAATKELLEALDAP